MINVVFSLENLSSNSFVVLVLPELEVVEIRRHIHNGGVRGLHELLVEPIVGDLPNSFQSRQSPVKKGVQRLLFLKFRKKGFWVKRVLLSFRYLCMSMHPQVTF